MKEIFEYGDFCEFIKDFQQCKQESHSGFSLRYIANKVGLDSGYFAKILQSKVLLPERFIGPMAELFKLSAREKEYFSELVLYSRARTQEKRKEHFEKLLILRDMEFHTLSIDQFEYYSKAYHSAIRALVEFFDFKGDYTKLGKKLSPSINAKQAQASIELLDRLALIEKNQKGIWKPKNQFISSGEFLNSEMICAHQQEMFKFGLESIDRHDKNLRDMSTLTVTLKQESMTELKAKVAKFRKEILQWIGEQDNEDMVVQMNFQIFPLSDNEVN